MTLDPVTLLAILAMACATILTRMSGLVFVKMLRIGARERQILESIPPAVLMAVIAPTALATGWPETVAAAATALAATRLPLLPSAALGVVVVATLRMLSRF